jgi:type II secretory pathway pseudopilin PulG
MSTGLIIAIVVVALILIALAVMLPRMRTTARRKQAERELHNRRQAVASEHRSEAAQRQEQADIAEQKARMAQQAAERERAEASISNERAEMHERGLADDELIDDHERDRFADVANPPTTPDGAEGDAPRAGTADRDGDGHTVADYEQGREDERRFERGDRITDDVRDSERTNG